jgi:hypothetical protein
VPSLPRITLGAQLGPLSAFGTISVDPNGISISGDVSFGGITLLVGDGISINGVLATPQWGVFNSIGFPIATFESFIKTEYDKEYQVANYPLAGGKFESYNKVERPYDQRVVFAQGGQLASRANFLVSLQTALADTNLYIIVTPEVTYKNANLTRMGYRREAESGVTLLQVELLFQEIRIGTSPAFSSTAQPQGASQQAVGSVQPQTPTAAQAMAAAGGAR